MSAPILAEPLPLPSGVVLPNRLAKSAMSEGLADAQGHANETHARLYERWGEGGAGLLITGNVMLAPEFVAEPGNVVLDEHHPLEPLQAWARAGQAGGGQIWVQINHPGRQVPRGLGVTPVAPSAVAVDLPGFPTPRALEDDEILDIVRRFGVAARRAQEAGFDGVQIHGAHGYLVSQFLSPRTNLRDDRWGGDAEGRRRFLMEVLAEIQRVAPGLPVGVKLNSADFQKGGFEEDESLAVVKALAAAGVDLVEISGGTYERPEMFEVARESTRRREAFFLEFAERVRGEVDVPLMVTGGFRSGGAMTEAVQGGSVDVVGLARPLAVEPDLPARILADPSVAAAPIELPSLHSKVDGMVQGAWYGLQLRRMGRGKAPDPKLSRFSALWAYVRAMATRPAPRAA